MQFRLTSLLIASAALAQEETAMLEAKRHFDEGQVLYLQSRFGEAADEFERAHAVRPFPAFLFNEAVCREKANQFDKAIDRYARYIVSDPKAGERPDIERRIEGLREKMQPQAVSQPTSALPSVTTRGVVVIESKPAGASVWIDDRSQKSLGVTPLSTSLDGRHTVFVELAGYKPDKEELDFNISALTHIRVALSEEHYLGWVEIVTPGVPGADVYLDQREAGAVGKTPFMGNLPPGKHKLWLERSGFAPIMREFDVQPGGTHRVEVVPTAIRHGFLAVTGRTTQGATVRVDDHVIDCRGAYPCRIELPAGKFQVAVSADGKRTYEHEVEIVGQRETKLRVQLQDEPPRTTAYVTMGIGAALVGAGVVFGVKSNQARDDLESDIQNENILVGQTDSRASEGKVYAALADGLFIVGGLVSTIGVYYFFTSEGPESLGDTEISPLALSPFLGPNGGGLAASVSFR